MISVEKAYEIVLANCRPMALEKVGLLEALGRVIGEDVYARRDLPSFDNSAKDGYAVRAEDTKGACASKPVLLRVIETIAAGVIPRKTVGKGQAARIMTGAVLPRGANAVVCREDVDESVEMVSVKRSVTAGRDVRLMGEDVQKGQRVIQAGSVLRPAHIGMLAALGRPFVAVYRRPSVAIMSAGDELVDIETDPPDGKIVNSNGYALAALVKGLGGVPILCPILRDRKADIEKAFEQVKRADVVLSSGGVSVGDFDFVKDVMNQNGHTLLFWRVAMKPGKPMAFGFLGDTPIFGLPGNPVSVLVTFEQFVRPFLLRMQGHRCIQRKTRKAAVDQDITKEAGMRHFLRAVVTNEKGRYVARLTGSQSSGVLQSMVQANAFIVLDENTVSIKKNEKITVQVLDNSLI
jgi:molybdopterin molybdotransferase